jgi:BolA protein
MAQEANARLLQLCIESQLCVVHFSFNNFSSQHGGHYEAAREHITHVHLTIVAKEFSGISRISRHRLVHQCINNADFPYLHAVTLTCLSPEEWTVVC